MKPGVLLRILLPTSNHPKIATLHAVTLKSCRRGCFARCTLESLKFMGHGRVRGPIYLSVQNSRCLPGAPASTVHVPDQKAAVLVEWLQVEDKTVAATLTEAKTPASPLKSGSVMLYLQFRTCWQLSRELLASSLASRRRALPSLAHLCTVELSFAFVYHMLAWL